MGRCGRQNMLPPYLKIWEWEWIFGRALKAISSLGVRSPCFQVSSWIGFLLWFSSSKYFWNVEYQIFVIDIFFDSGRVFQFGVHSGYYNGVLTQKRYFLARTTDTQWRHKSKISEKMGRCGRQNMLPPYLKIWDWDLIFGCAVKAISSPGIRSPCWNPVWPHR